MNKEKPKRGFVDKYYGEYFKLPLSWEKLFENLTDSEIGQLIQVICDYAFYVVEPDEKKLTTSQKLAFGAMKRDIDFQFEHPRSRTLKDNGQDYEDRHCLKYQEWRRDVFERDNYVCVLCKQRGGKLNAHHIKPFAKYPEYRFELNNGITLCKSCHIAIHRGEKQCPAEY